MISPESHTSHPSRAGNSCMLGTPLPRGPGTPPTKHADLCHHDAYLPCGGRLRKVSRSLIQKGTQVPARRLPKPDWVVADLMEYLATRSYAKVLWPYLNMDDVRTYIACILACLQENTLACHEWLANIRASIMKVYQTKAASRGEYRATRPKFEIFPHWAVEDVSEYIGCIILCKLKDTIASHTLLESIRKQIDERQNKQGGITNNAPPTQIRKKNKPRCSQTTKRYGTKARCKQPKNDVAWDAMLAKLVDYKKKHGDCNVPRSFLESKPLGNWVHFQRSYKKKLDTGDLHPGITKARIAKLDKVQFAWKLSSTPLGKIRRDDDRWEANMAKLQKYKEKCGDCNVPRNFVEDQCLGNWVHRQRSYKKKLDTGDLHPGITQARIAKLDKVQFAWLGRPNTNISPIF